MIKFLLNLLLYILHFIVTIFFTYYVGDIMSKDILLLSVVGLALGYVILYVTFILHTKRIISLFNQLKNKV